MLLFAIAVMQLVNYKLNFFISEWSSADSRGLSETVEKSPKKAVSSDGVKSSKVIVWPITFHSKEILGI